MQAIASRLHLNLSEKFLARAAYNLTFYKDFVKFKILLYNLKMVGCHVSISKGIEKAPEMAHELECEVMQIFTRPPMGGPAPELTNEICEQFKIKNLKFQIHEVYIHAPYFINLASLNNRIRYGSISAIKKELERGSQLGAKYVMTHLGSAKDMGEKEAIKKTINGLKKVFDGYKGKTKLLIENSAGASKIIGDDFIEIGKILKSLKKYPAMAGLCLDTQHSFASGYDWLNNFEKNAKLLDKHIGIKNIKLIHANDSATDLSSHKDRHEHIGKGKIGLEGFKKIAQFARKNNINMICETDYPEVIEDMKILKKMK